MYSAPRRSVHTFLQAIEQVWQPMHLSRWNTIEICVRTPIIPPRFRSELRLRQLADAHRGVAVDAGGAPVVEVVGELAVAADHQHRLQAHARQAVVSARAPPSPPPLL